MMAAPVPEANDPDNDGFTNRTVYTLEKPPAEIIQGDVLHLSFR